MDAVMTSIRKPADDNDPDGSVSDRELLVRFADQRDELAFADLTARHGGLVLGVCRRVLHHQQDVEDAFQATFMVLARDAARIRKRDSLAGWLYGVAYRTALRAAVRRHRRREMELVAETMIAADALEQLSSRHEQQLLDEELHRLPEKYRDPLVLRYLQGKSNKEVAAELDITVTAIEGRLKRGKDELRVRLARRGVGLLAALAAVHATQQAIEAATIHNLAAATAQACVSFTASSSTSSAAHSPAAAQLAAKEQMTMLATTPIAKGACGAALLGVAVVAVAFAGQGASTRGNRHGNVVVAASAAEAPAAAAGDSVRIAQGNASAAAPAPRTVSPSRPFHFKATSPAVQQIEAALEEDTEVDFIETPLSDVVAFLEDRHGIQIELDTRALDDIGIGADSPITKNLRGISLRSALRLMLRELGLAYLIKDEVLLITTDDVAAKTVEMRVYDVSWLGGDSDLSEQMASLVRRAVLSDTWRPAEGSPATAGSDYDPDVCVGIVESLPGALVVTHTQQAHDEVVELLHQLFRLRTSQQQ